jgi:ribonuclease HI
MMVIGVEGFLKHLGWCPACVAELWGILEGLRLTWGSRFKKVELQVDSKIVVHILNSNRICSVAGWRLINQIRRLLALDWEIKVCHTHLL